MESIAATIEAVEFLDKCFCSYCVYAAASVAHVNWLSQPLVLSSVSHYVFNDIFERRLAAALLEQTGRARTARAKWF